MSSVNILVGCLAVMGAVQSNEENGDPPQDIQQTQQHDGDPLQQVRPPQQDRTLQQDQPPQQDRTPQRDQTAQHVPHRNVLLQFDQCPQGTQGFDQRDTQSSVAAKERDVEDLITDTTFEQIPVQQKLIQKGDDSITLPQLGCLIQYVIFAGLFSSMLIKTLLKNQVSYQTTTHPKKTGERLYDQQQSQDKEHSQKVQRYIHQQEQEVRLPTQRIQERVAKLLADIQTQLQAVATESAPAACKQRLFDTCVGGLRAAALC